MHGNSSSLKTLWSAIGLGITGSSIFNLTPLFLAAADRQFQLNANSAGLLAGSELAGIAFISATTPFWLHRFDHDKLACIALLLMASGNCLSLFCHSYDQLLLSRFFIGLFGSGIVYIIAIVVLGNTGNAVKNFALLVLLQMLVSGIVLSAMPTVFQPLALIHILLFYCILAVAGLLTVRFVPARHRSTPINIHTIKSLSSLELLLLAGMFLITFNLGIIWSFSERIGLSSGLSTQEIGTLLGASMLPQAFGAVLPALLGCNLGYIAPLAFALSGQLLGLLILTMAETGNSYFLGISLWGSSSFNLGISYQLGLISRLPDNNRVLALVPGIQAIALASGPSLSALFILDDDLSSANIIAAIAAFTGSILFMLLSDTVCERIVRPDIES